MQDPSTLTPDELAAKEERREAIQQYGENTGTPVREQATETDVRAAIERLRAWSAGGEAFTEEAEGEALSVVLDDLARRLDVEDGYDWKVVHKPGGKVDLAVGEMLSGMDPTAAVFTIGQAMGKIGTHLAITAAGAMGAGEPVGDEVNDDD